MKLSQLVIQYSQKRVADARVPEGTHDYYKSLENCRQQAWSLILDELSDELFKLAGNGLPIQGQRRIAKALGIAAPEAPEQKLNDKAE